MNKLKLFPNVFFYFSTKKDGNMDFRFGGKSEVMENRRRFFKKGNIPLERSIFMSVLHTDNILLVDEKDLKAGCFDLKTALPTDCLVTLNKNIFLCLLVADCLPIVVYDDKRKIISLIHAGWKGLDKKIITKIVSFLESNFGCNSKDLKVFIGPGIRKESYVFSQVKQKGQKDWKDFIKKTKDDLFTVDLVGFAKSELFNKGIRRRNIFDCHIDTAKDQSLYSHFKDKEEKRFVCVVAMV